MLCSVYICVFDSTLRICYASRMERATNAIGIRLIPWIVGIGAGLLVARLVARLFAGRADNSSLAALYRLTDPLVAPLRRLDAGQPRFGAVLELSTLALLVLLVLAGYGAWRFAHFWRNRRPWRERDA